MHMRGTDITTSYEHASKRSILMIVNDTQLAKYLPCINNKLTSVIAFFSLARIIYNQFFN